MKRVSSKRGSALLIFSKGSGDDNVKTRLKPALNTAERMSLHQALLKDAISKARHIGTNNYLYLTGQPEFSIDTDIPLKMQRGGDLGERMLNAFRETIPVHQRVVIIGTDSPALTVDTIQDAFNALVSHEVVIGPTEDGGYYLIGLSQIVPEIFSGISWGTDMVLGQTVERMNSHAYYLLPVGFDVDVPSDLERLMKMRNELEFISPEIKKWLDRRIAGNNQNQTR